MGNSIGQTLTLKKCNYNDKDQMKKIMEYDEECRNSKFVIVETPIHPPNESSDEDNEEKLYALGFL